MPAEFYRDSKGNLQYVLKQEHATTCGPASVAMVESAYKRMCMIDPEIRARQISQKYPGAWQPATGTQVTNLPYVLNEEGVKAYGAVDAKPSGVWSYISYYARELTPVIVHISWTPSGGHFAVCKQIYPDGTVIFLDPWYGLVEVRSNNLPSYNPPGATGQLSGWIVVTHW